jgi:TatD DNase family protein
MTSPFQIVDTHTHLCDPAFDTDRDEVLQRARDVGIVSILLASENMDDATKNLTLANKYTMLRPMAGLYPTAIDPEQAEIMMTFIRQSRNELLGIGEVGLDFWAVKEESQRAVQKDIFIGFVELSKQLNLPLNVHSRSAGRHVIHILLERCAGRVQLHAFDGKASTALPAVEAGLYFSIPPSIVRSRQKQKLVKQLPLSCLLVETDSPVLGSEPGQRNEPAHILKAVDAIAEIKGKTRQEIIETTLDNTKRLYGDHVL